MKPLSSAITSIPRSGIRELMDLAWSTPGVIHLEVGEPNFATPDHILEAAARAGAEGYTKYTPNAGIPEVREAFAAKVTAHNGFTSTPENIVVTVGAINALASDIEAWVTAVGGAPWEISPFPVDNLQDFLLGATICGIRHPGSLSAHGYSFLSIRVRFDSIVLTTGNPTCYLSLQR